MQNLHHIGIRHTTPWFIGIINGLGVDVHPQRDARALRRFIIGENLTPISEPKKIDVPSSIVIEINITSGNNIDSLFDGAKDELVKAVLAKGIALSSITCVELVAGETRGNFYYVAFMREETDAELAERKINSDKFNQILSLKNEIYLCIDERIKSNE